MRNSSRGPWDVEILALFVFALGIGGCAMANPFLSSGPEPRVEDCALIQQATPSRWVCNGKVYTSVQLTDIRNGKTPELK